MQIPDLVKKKPPELHSQRANKGKKHKTGGKTLLTIWRKNELSF